MSDEVEEVLEHLIRHAPTIYRLYIYYSAADSGAPFMISGNAYSLLCDHCKFEVKGSKDCETQHLDQARPEHVTWARGLGAWPQHVTSARSPARGLIA